jgi:hypothetical protein
MKPDLVLFECLVYVVFAACLVGAIRRSPFDMLELLWTAVYGFLLEWMTLNLLHAYHYGEFVLMIGGAPIAVALGWAAIINTGMMLSDRIQLPDSARPLVDALTALNIDLTLDTIAVRIGLWVWTGFGIDEQWFGVPWANFWAWFLVVWTFSALLRALRPWQRLKLRRWLYPAVAALLSLVVLAVALGLYPLMSDIGTQAIASLLLVAGSAVVILALRPRVVNDHVAEITVLIVPLAFHAFALFMGTSSGAFRRQPALAVVGLAMLATSVFVHRWVGQRSGTSGQADTYS